MRGYQATLLLTLIVFAGAGGYLELEARKLRRFCGTIAQGQTIAQVRETAQELGYSSAIEPFAQMRISPRLGDPAGRSCRVFFNKEQTVEYRVFQGS